MTRQVRTLKSVNCPTCSAIVEWAPAQRWRPFCSERCKLIDLGSWFDESNRIPAADPLEESDYDNHPEV